jgi:ATP-dependent helicase/nuclease subunit A
MSHRGDEFAVADYQQVASESSQTDQLWASDKITDVRFIGTATHLVIQHIDLSKPVTLGSVINQIKELEAKSAITPALAKMIKAEKIVTFFNSDLGTRIRNSKIVHREWPFSFALPASCMLDHCPEGGDDNIIVQGIIDLLAENDDGLVIVDFKTDRVSAETAQSKAQAYSEQLNLYSQAASAIIGKPVISKYLYFLSASTAVQV